MYLYISVVVCVQIGINQHHLRAPRRSTNLGSNDDTQSKREMIEKMMGTSPPIPPPPVLTAQQLLHEREQHQRAQAQLQNSKKPAANNSSNSSNANSQQQNNTLPVTCFTKEAVPQRSSISSALSPSSSLARQLNHNGLLMKLQSSRYEKAARMPATLELDVYLHCNTANPILYHMKLGSGDNANVSQVISNIRQQHIEATRGTEAEYDQAQEYELYMIDDLDADEDGAVGYPDLDLPPLESGKDIREFGMTEFALIPKAGGETNNNMARTSIEAAPCRSIKIHLSDHESYTLPLPLHHDVHDLFVSLMKKKNNPNAKAELYQFEYLDAAGNEGIDMKCKIAELRSDELNLVHKSSLHSSSHHPFTLSPTSPPLPLPEHFQFNLETAGSYAEYKVIKTNQRGRRQARVFAVDRYKLYNKTCADESNSAFSFFKRRISTSDQGVTRAFRYINTIASVHVVAMRPNCFW